MPRPSLCRFRRFAALGLVAALGLSGPAFALFPPPYYYPPAIIIGDPDPPPPPPDPCDCTCCTCPPGNTHATPEPATMISGLLGLGLLGGYTLRRKLKK